MANVEQVVPFLAVSSMEVSLRYYVDGLGFTVTHKWVVDDKIRWCWLRLGGAALMLQETVAGSKGSGGVSLWFICKDAIAIYRDVTARRVAASEPQVGNGMWVTTLEDPDGYRINFESPADAAEETKLSELPSAT